MKPVATNAAATGREYWRLKRVEREKFFVFFVITEMILVALAVFFALILNKNKNSKAVFDSYFAFALAFGIAAILVGGLFLLFFFWYGNRPTKGSKVILNPDDDTFEAEIIGFTGKKRKVKEPIRYYSDNGVYTKIGRSKRSFIWLANRRMAPSAKRALARIGEHYEAKKHPKKNDKKTTNE